MHRSIISDTLAHYTQKAGNIHLAFYLIAADELGIKYRVLFPSYAEFIYKDKHWFISRAMTPLNSMTAKVFADYKHLTAAVLKERDISVPRQILVYSVEELIKAKKELGRIVVKPPKGSGGKGITILPETREELEQAFKAATQKKGYAIAEEYFEGENYRILVLGNRVLSVIKRIPACVVGDGLHTIKELIDLENEKKKARLSSTIKINYDLELILRRQDYSLDSVPSNGVKVYVHGTSNLSEGGTVEDASESLAKEYFEVALKAAEATNLVLGGIDIMVKNPREFGEYIINEVNHSPGMRIPYFATGKNFAVDILEYIIETL